jgi:hypothetical protein
MFYGFILKKSGNKYNDLDTKPSPFRMIALTTSPVFTKEGNREQGTGDRENYLLIVGTSLWKG